MRFPIPARRAARLLADSPVSFNFTVTAHIRGPLVREQLENALLRLCVRHPLMGSHVLVTEDGQSFLTDEGAAAPQVRVIPRLSGDTWVAVVDQELLIRPDYRTGPLFRCVWVRGDGESDLILVIDHGTADGRSAIFALRDLLELLAEPALRLEPIHPIRMAEATTDPIALRAAEMSASVPPDGPPPPPWTPVLSDERRTINPLTLSKAETAALLSLCRSEGVTVQAALCAAFLKPFAERHGEAPIRLAEIPFDLRPYLKKPGKDWYGSFISLAVIEVDCSPDQSLWDIARRAQAALKRINIEELFFVPPAVYQIADRVPKLKMFDAEYDVSISNLGRLDLESTYGQLELTGVHAPTFNVVMPKHRVLGVSTSAGRLCATYTARDPEAPALAQRGLDFLREMIG